MPLEAETKMTTQVTKDELLYLNLFGQAKCKHVVLVFQAFTNEFHHREK